MDNNFINSLLNNTFVLECPKIILSPLEPTVNKETYQGPGEIKLNKEGQLRFKIYCSGQVPLHEIFVFRTKPGELIKSTEYYTLTAYGLGAIKWTAERILKDINAGSPASDGYVVHGSIGQLVNEDILPPQITKKTIHYIFRGTMDFPCNRSVIKKTEIEKEERFVSIARSIAGFKSCGMEFKLSQKEGYTSLSVNCDDDIEISNDLIIKITGALQFVLSHSLSWLILETNQQQVKKTLIRPDLGGAEKTRIPPPVPFNQCNDLNSIWKLFDKFLSHNISATDSAWKSTYFHIHSIIEAGTASMEAEALTLGVAIEGILKTDFTELALPDNDFIEEIKLLIKILSKSDFSNNFKKRVPNKINSLRTPSAIDRLLELYKRGLIDKSLIEAWNKIRHSSVHADNPDYTDFQKFLNKRGSLIVLYYQLIFLSVGYTGEYCDYSTIGYPTRVFDKFYEKSGETMAINNPV